MRLPSSASLCALLALYAWPSTPARAQAPASGPTNAVPSSIAAPAAISISTLVPPDQRILPMPLSQRIQTHAVPTRGMCSTVPAVRAPDGLISGNGKMYVEVFGNPFSEQVIVHHERLLTPWKDGPLEAPQIASLLPEVRRLILAGHYRQASELVMAKASEGRTKPETANLREHPAFTLRIDTPVHHAVHDYLRTIDFERGEVKVQWADDQGTWVRRTFVSRPDNVIVQQLTAPAGASIHATLSLDTSAVLPGSRPAQATRTFTPRAGAPQPLADPGATEIRFTQRLNSQPDSRPDSQYLTLQGRYVIDHGTPGYASVTRVITQGGSTHADGNSLVLDGVHSATLLTRVQTYDTMDPAGATDATAQPAVAALTHDLIHDLIHDLDQLDPSYDALMLRHQPIQSTVIDRASIDFGGASLHQMSGEEMLTDQRTRLGYNPALLANLFDMGRYWLYLRSGDFPPMWGHVNINVNLQLSGAVMEDLPEAMHSYVQWVEGLLPDSHINARNIFGARGALFAIHPTSRGGQLDHFAYGWPHQYWISAGGWMYSPMWDYYLATDDREFLRAHIMPGLEEIALFYEDYLTQTDQNGKYIFVPSYSPENWPSNSESSPAVINATMDITVCREVFTHLIEASETLGINSDAIPRWQAILAKLPPYLLDTDGSLKEWAWPTLEEGVSLDHRHDSHLYGVWPADEITPDTTPELARAAWLAARKRAQGNASAHGILHRALVATRLRDPYLVNFDLKEILEQGYVNPSLTTLHNPYSYPAPDPQGALPTILMEMLVYSRPGVIGLLPAIPATLTQGTAKGILCRTGARIDDLSWNLDTRRLSVTISSRKEQTIQLFAGGGIESIEEVDAVNAANAPGAAATPGAPASTLHATLASKPAPGSEQVAVHLSPNHPVTLRITLGKEDRSHWITNAAHVATNPANQNVTHASQPPLPRPDSGTSTGQK